MRIWKNEVTLAELNGLAAGSMLEAIGIVFIELGADYLKATMPVDERTRQPFGILHGGASVALAETVGSAAAQLCIDRQSQSCVGLEINANHIRAVRGGAVEATGRPVHLGRRTQVWHIELRDSEGELVCIARHTVAVLDKKQ